MEQNNSKETDDWAKEAIHILKAKGYLEKTNRPMFMIGFAILIAGMIAGGCILYAVNNDAFKSSNNQSVVCSNIPACNFPNITIPKCPEQTFVCNTTCNYPNNFSIKLVNMSV